MCEADWGLSLDPLSNFALNYSSKYVRNFRNHYTSFREIEAFFCKEWAGNKLRTAFRGSWMRADQGSASVFALDLPMNRRRNAGANEHAPCKLTSRAYHVPCLPPYHQTRPSVAVS